MAGSRGGIRSVTASRIASRSTLKYKCVTLSRMPAISFQGMAGYQDRIVEGTFLAASPITSIVRTTALNVFYR